ncbi:MAG: cytochrome c oxidase subunit II [bacterium]
MTATLMTLAALWMPEKASTYAHQTDWAFYFVLWISVFFTLLIAGLVLLFAVRQWDGGLKGALHGHGGRGKPGKGPTHNTALEMTWTIIPLILVIAIFIFGFRPFLNMTTPPDDAYEVLVQAQKWNWNFKYPNGVTSPDGKLHVPAGVPILATLTVPSDDVIHSFYVPAFRTKQDAVPGRYNKTWFEAVWHEGSAEELTVEDQEQVHTFQVNRYPLYCTEYCGQGHSDMITEVVVHADESSFARWLEIAGGPVEATAEVGERIVSGKGGCLQCHTVDGTPSTAPTFKDLYGSEEELVSGTVTVDDEYIRESILDPQAEIVARYRSAAPMSSYRGLLSEGEILAIIEYMKSISTHVDQRELNAGDDDDDATE